MQYFDFQAARLLHALPFFVFAMLPHPFLVNHVEIYVFIVHTITKGVI